MSTPSPTPTQFISFGYRCSSAGILKQLQLKTESHPFDWIVSRLPVIQHCLETDFRHFIQDISNTYFPHHTKTIHYDTNHPENDVFICDETVYYNTYYAKFPLSPFHTTFPLSIPEDTYAYPLLLNHHNIHLSETQSYFTRCIGRLNEKLSSPYPRKMYLYIHPALSLGEWNRYRETLLQELLAFQLFLQCRYPETFPKGLLFLPIKTECPYPITTEYPTVLEEIQNTLSAPTPEHPEQCAIYLVYMNKDFIDAGEIFMRNAYIETETILQKIREYM